MSYGKKGYVPRAVLVDETFHGIPLEFIFDRHALSILRRAVWEQPTVAVPPPRSINLGEHALQQFLTALDLFDKGARP